MTTVTVRIMSIPTGKEDLLNMTNPPALLHHMPEVLQLLLFLLPRVLNNGELRCHFDVGDQVYDLIENKAICQ